jgi:DNA-binding CsgD family transcriptional regulator
VANAIQPSAEPDWPFATKAISSIATDFEGRENAKAVELAKAIRDATSPVALANHRRASMAIDVEAHLGRLTMPTLVTHDPYFAFGSFDLCQEVAAGIGSAGLVTMDANSLAGDFHDCHVEAIDQFLRAGESSTLISAAVSTRDVRYVGIRLTARESEVLGLLATGLSNKEIAFQLTLAVPTVERHLVNAYAKIGARGRVDATAFALSHGLIPDTR